ncbi:hypothetical protein D9M71_692430 [compost metagenome]
MLAVARKAATGAGAPSYTSGVHRWNGTNDSLKARPTSIMARPSCASRLGMLVVASALPIPLKLRLPASA